MKKLNIRNVSMMGVLIALDIVATRFLGFSALTIRISFGSVFIILAGLWFGPVEGALVGGIADTLGCLIAGTGFYPPLMISPIVLGILIGLGRPWFLKKVGIARLGILIGGSYMMTTLFIASWALSMLYGSPYLALVASRIPQYLVNATVCTLILCDLQKCGDKGSNRQFSGGLKNLFGILTRGAKYSMLYLAAEESPVTRG